MITQF